MFFTKKVTRKGGFFVFFSYICDSRAQDKENDETVYLFF